MRDDYWKRYKLDQANSDNLLKAIAGLERERNLYLVKLRRFERKRIRQKMRGIRQPRALDTLALVANNENWIIYAGDCLIRKKHRLSPGKLSTHENAILCFWAIDYAVRNAGCIDEAQEIHSGAKDELHDYAQIHALNATMDLLTDTDNEHFAMKFCDLFENCCDEIRQASDF